MRDTRVVIVEDQTILRESLVKALDREEGLAVAGHWSTAEEALRSMQESSCDVAIVDNVLPGMDGISLTRRIREICPAAAVIILTMYDRVDDALQAFEAGAKGFLLKRNSVASLVQAIREVRRGETVIDPRISEKIVSYYTAGRKMKNKGDHLREDYVRMLRFASNGLSNKEIAHKMGIGIEGVKSRFKSLFSILSAQDRTHAVAEAFRLGLLKLDE